MKSQPTFTKPQIKAIEKALTPPTRVREYRIWSYYGAPLSVLRHLEAKGLLIEVDGDFPYDGPRLGVLMYVPTQDLWAAYFQLHPEENDCWCAL